MGRAIFLSLEEGVAHPIALLRGLGALLSDERFSSRLTVRVLDLVVSDLSDLGPGADWVIVSLPTFPAVLKAVQISDKIRSSAPSAKLIAVGQHATLQGPAIKPFFDEIVRGDPVGAILNFFCHEFGYSTSELVEPSIVSLPRHLCRPLEDYGVRTPQKGLVGNVEVTVGCKYSCVYCSVPAITGNKVSVASLSSVVADVDFLVLQGAEHLVFEDADFFNLPYRAMEIVRAIHARYPGVTFEITTRVAHIIEFKHLLAELLPLGCLKVTSAFDFPNDSILLRLAKGHTVADMREAAKWLTGLGLALEPTFVAFMPWLSYDEHCHLPEFSSELCLIEPVPKFQLSTRLQLFWGSPILARPELMKDVCGEKGPNSFVWMHRDDRVETLYEERVSQAGNLAGRCCLRC